jgi:hypothetical protein
MYHATFKTVVKNIVSKSGFGIEKVPGASIFSKRLSQNTPIPVLSGEAFKAMKFIKNTCKIARYVYNGFWQFACKYSLIMENKSF